MATMFDDKLTTSEYTLLFAEDEQGLRDAYSAFFVNYFKNVISVDNGNDAWKSYLENKPEVVVLDILMPGLNGIEVAEKIREEDKDTVIIIMTANDTKEWLYSSIELGLTKFIKKGTIKFTEFEKLLLEITQSLDSKVKKENNDIEVDDTFWYISPKGSEIEISWDTTNHKIYKNGEIIPLSKKLTQLINYFSQNRDRIITLDELAKELWETENTEDKKTSSEQKIRAFLYNLRKRLGVDIFQSIYKQGYKINFRGNSIKEQE